MSNKRKAKIKVIPGSEYRRRHRLDEEWVYDEFERKVEVPVEIGEAVHDAMMASEAMCMAPAFSGAVIRRALVTIDYAEAVVRDCLAASGADLAVGGNDVWRNELMVGDVMHDGEKRPFVDVIAERREILNERLRRCAPTPDDLPAVGMITIIGYDGKPKTLG